MRQPLCIALVLAAGVTGFASPAWTAGPYTFTSIAPCRLLDTRLPSPNPFTTSGEIRAYNVWNRCGVPGTDALDPNRATAIYANVTAVDQTNDGHLRVYDGGLANPVLSSVVNFVTGSSAIANGVLVNLSSAGQIKVLAAFAGSGSVNVIVDILGYYTAQGPLHFYGLPACRLLDTRNPNDWDGGFGGGPKITANLERAIKVQSRCGVPLGAEAATVTLTVVGPTDEGFLVAYPLGTSMPQASTINFPPLIFARANGTIVPLAVPNGSGYDLAVKAAIGISGTLDLLIDVTGYYKE